MSSRVHRTSRMFERDVRDTYRVNKMMRALRRQGLSRREAADVVSMRLKAEAQHPTHKTARTRKQVRKWPHRASRRHAA